MFIPGQSWLLERDVLLDYFEPLLQSIDIVYFGMLSSVVEVLILHFEVTVEALLELFGLESA